jgi:hypothetical protein
VDAEDGGTFRFTFNHPIRGTEEHDLAITLVKCDRPVVSVRDRNGLPVITADGEAGFTFEAPVLFGPGRNVLSAQGLHAFTGRSREVAALPVTYRAASPGDTVECLAWTAGDERLRITGGGGELLVAQRVPEAEYLVATGGETRTLRSVNDVLTVPVPAGTTDIRIQPKP